MTTKDNTVSNVGDTIYQDAIKSISEICTGEKMAKTPELDAALRLGIIDKIMRQALIAKSRQDKEKSV